MSIPRIGPGQNFGVGGPAFGGGLPGAGGGLPIGPGAGLGPLGDGAAFSPEALENGVGGFDANPLLQALGGPVDPVQQRIQQLQQEIQITEAALQQAQAAGDEGQVEQLSGRLQQLQQELQQLMGGAPGAGEAGGGAPAGGGGGGAPMDAGGGGGAPAGGGGAPAGGGGAPAGGGGAPAGGGGAPAGGGGGPAPAGGAGNTGGATGPGTASAIPSPDLQGNDKALAAAIEEQLQGTPLAGKGLGAHFVQAGRQQNVDPLALVAISKHETNFGKLGVGIKKHMGVGAYDNNPNGKTPYDGAVQQIYSGAKTFANLRRKGGSTADAPMSSQLAAVNRAGWATDRNWHKGVGSHYNSVVAKANTSSAGKTMLASNTSSTPKSTPTPTKTTSTSSTKKT